MAALQRINRLLQLKDIKPNRRNARTHSKAQIRQIAESIKAFGFGAPVLVDEALTLIAGYGRLKAAESLNMPEIPAVQILGLSEAQKRAFALADNKIGDNAGWDRERLAIELPDLAELLIKENFDVSLTGFTPAEIDQLQVDFEENSDEPNDVVDQGWLKGPVVSKRGSLFVLDQHRLLCADARDSSDLGNVCVWVKTNAGQGSFYRSAHEFVVVFQVGKTQHLNNIQLGRHGRSRSNVWNYRGANAFGSGRLEELHSHPTVKPVALVADAIRDCTRRRDIVLDTFSGSGTTIMAAERVGRRAYAMDVEPRYIDVAVRRWQAFTKKDAVDAETGKTFDQLAEIAATVCARRNGDTEDQRIAPDSDTNG